MRRLLALLLVAVSMLPTAGALDAAELLPLDAVAGELLPGAPLPEAPAPGIVEEAIASGAQLALAALEPALSSPILAPLGLPPLGLPPLAAPMPTDAAARDEAAKPPLAPSEGALSSWGAARDVETPLGRASVPDPAPGSAPEDAEGLPLPPPAPSSPLDASATLATLAIGVTALLGALASLYSRFHKHTLLRSAPRARLHALVLERPGSTIAQLCADSGMTRGAVVHHVQLLVRHGLLASRHDGLHRRLYPPGAAPEPTRPPTPAETRLLDLLAQERHLTQRELARRLEVTPQAVSQQMQRLRRDGRLAMEGAPAPRPTPDVGALPDPSS